MQKTAVWVLLAFVPVFPVGAAEGPDAPVPEWKAGVASAAITPHSPLPMAGYAGRKEPADGTEQELFAKALAVADRDGQRVVFLTMDLIGVTERLRTAVAERVPPHALLMNASHTHCGPAYGRDEAKGYTCHNTTMGFRKWLGDYAGYAQEYCDRQQIVPLDGLRGHVFRVKLQDPLAALSAIAGVPTHLST